MNIIAIVYARYNSQRLPGKVLFQIGEDTILGTCVNKLKKIPKIKIFVATSYEETDSPIVEWCIENEIDYYRGDLGNVAKRTYDLLLEYPCDAFLRINADSPFLQPDLLMRAIQCYASEPNHDLVTNIADRTYPYGIAVELVKADSYKKYYQQFDEKLRDHEHITQFFYRNSHIFQVKNLYGETNLSHERWVLDTPEDWNKIRDLFTAYGDVFSYNTEQLHKLIQNPSKIN